MMDYVCIGSTPSEEECAQVGSKDYTKLSRLECSLYREQLQEQFPDGDFRIKSFPHDFGTYHEVVAYYDSDDDVQSQAAFDAESGAWTTWTPERKQKIADTKAEVFFNAWGE